MKILKITYDDRYWQELIEYAEKCSWSAGVNLAMAMKHHYFTEWERIFIAVQEGKIIGFCTLAKKDCIPNIPYRPYIGYVFVGEGYRGKRISEKLLTEAMHYAKELSFERVYLISDQVGLYEKYGFTPIDQQMAPWGRIQTIFSCAL